MANVLQKSTMQYYKSVHTPDFTGPDYLINPDLTAVEGVEPKHWKLDGDNVVPMTQAEQDAKDAEIATIQRNNAIANIESQFNNNPVWIAFARLMVQEINTLRTEAGLSTRTAQQFNTALEAEIQKIVT